MGPLDDRGQAYTLQGFIAAVIVASAVLYGLQAVDTAPWTGGSDEETTGLVRTQAADALDVAAADGMLRRSVTCLRPGGTTPHPYLGVKPTNAPRNVTELGGLLAATFPEDEYDYNVHVDYWNATEQRRNRTTLYRDFSNPPDENSVTVTRRVTLYDGMTVSENAAQRGCRSDEGSLADTDFYIDDVSEGELYNVVEVRLTVW